MSKKFFMFIGIAFILLSIGALMVNIPEKKNQRILHELQAYFPYKLKKELSGLDIVDTRTGKDLDIDNAKVFLAYDDFLKKWGKNHIKLDKNNLIIYDKDKILKKFKINKKEKEWVVNFFNLERIDLNQ